MDNKKDDVYYVNKIITDLAFILKQTTGLTQSALENNEILVDSVMFRLIQVSENSAKLTDEFKELYKTVPWRAIKGMRNKIVHEYGNVDMSVIYETVINDIPLLLDLLRKIVM